MHYIDLGRLSTLLPVRSCQWVSGMSLSPGSKNQILFSVEAFTSQIHSESSPQEFFQGGDQRAGSQFNKCARLDNFRHVCSCLSGLFFFFLSCCSIAMSLLLSLCVHMHVLCIKSLFSRLCLSLQHLLGARSTQALTAHAGLSAQHKTCSSPAWNKAAQALEAAYEFWPGG